MRLRLGLIAGHVMIASTVLGALALAQPRSGRPPRPTPRPSVPEKHAPAPPVSADAEPTAVDRSTPGQDNPATSPPMPAGDAGGSGPGPVFAPPPVGAAAGGTRLSALNPARNEFSDAGASAPSDDYERLLSDVASLRSRVAAVSDTLFHSRLAVALETSADHARVAGLSLSLDDGVVWTSPSPLAAREAVVVYDHAVAPGRHELAVHVEFQEEGSPFRSSQQSRFVVEVPGDERLLVEVKVWDDSSVNDFPRSKRGEYDLRIRARESAQPLGR